VGSHEVKHLDIQSQRRHLSMNDRHAGTALLLSAAGAALSSITAYVPRERLDKFS
jgi:hypothetical protein